MEEAERRRVKRLRANREASAASRRRKRELEREMRARVGRLERLTAALASENATLKSALLELTCGVRVGAGEVMMDKVPLPNWDGRGVTGRGGGERGRREDVDGGVAVVERGRVRGRLYRICASD